MATQDNKPQSPAAGAPTPSAGQRQRASLDQKVDESSDESFPASDPPASHLKDEPPANSQAKWDAARAHAEDGRETHDPKRSRRP